MTNKRKVTILGGAPGWINKQSSNGQAAITKKMEQHELKNDDDDGSVNKSMDMKMAPIATSEHKATNKNLPALSDIIF